MSGIRENIVKHFSSNSTQITDIPGAQFFWQIFWEFAAVDLLHLSDISIVLLILVTQVCYESTKFWRFWGLTNHTKILSHPIGILICSRQRISDFGMLHSHNNVDTKNGPIKKEKISLMTSQYQASLAYLILLFLCALLGCNINDMPMFSWS